MSFDLPIVEPKPPIEPPSSLVVRFGRMRSLGEFPFDGPERPRCGAKVVIRSRRGTEIAEVLTTTCTNTGCAMAVPRPQLLSYIEASGGDDFPFSTEGRVLRIATPEDLKEQARIEAKKPEYLSTCRRFVQELDLDMRVIDVDLILGGEMVTFFFMSEHRVDFRQLVKQLAAQFHTRIQMHQVGARDEARLVADFETCGQHCCCRQFLKVLRPVSMGAAKMQKATLDPSKISGRCGRLKCCLRYEEEGYEELRRKLPRVGSRVRTEEGIGVVEETMILTQLVRIRLGEDRFVAIANEEILDRDVPEGAVAEPRREVRPPVTPAAAVPPPPPLPAATEPAQARQRPPLRPAQRPPAPRPPAPATMPPAPQAAPPDNAAAQDDEARPQGVGALGRRRRRRGRGRSGQGPSTGSTQPPA